MGWKKADGVAWHDGVMNESLNATSGIWGHKHFMSSMCVKKKKKKKRKRKKCAKV